MNTKFEQLLDYLVNEEMDKANELFHEIVVEKSRDIYQNLINEEEEDEEEANESMHDEEDEEEANESMHDGEEELEDSYSLDMDEADDDEDSMDFDASMDDEEPLGGDSADKILPSVSDDNADPELMDLISQIQDELDQLKDKIVNPDSDGMGDMDGMDDMDNKNPMTSDDEGSEIDDFDDEEDDEEDEETKASEEMFEGRRLTREYKEKVGNDWEKNNQKAQGKDAGAGSGEKMGSPNEGKSPISSGSGKPTSSARAIHSKSSGEGTNTGTSPTKPSKGLAPHSGEKFAAGRHNVDGVKSGVKTLTGVKGGHGAERKGAGPGPVGSGSGDTAGQTSIAPETKKSFLKPYKQ